MKIQYLGLLPAILLFCWAHWRLITFYRKYKTLDYFDERVPSHDSPTMAIMVCGVLDMFLMVGGIAWALI